MRVGEHQQDKMVPGGLEAEEAVSAIEMMLKRNWTLIIRRTGIDSYQCWCNRTRHRETIERRLMDSS